MQPSFTRKVPAPVRYGTAAPRQPAGTRAEPDRTLADMATELADVRHRLDALDSGDLDQHGQPIAVRAAFDLSYHHLLSSQPGQARLFRLLPLDSCHDIALQAATALTGAPAIPVRLQLAALARAHLITNPATSRWGMHDLSFPS